MKITFIGGGNMAEAILRTLLSQKIVPAREVTVDEINDARCQYLKQKYGIMAINDAAAIQKSDVIVLAVKPQNLPGVLTELSGRLLPRQLVLSIAAGVKLVTLVKGLNHKHVVRSMPNSPAQIGEGMTVWTVTPQVTEKQKEWARTILSVMGKELYVSDENYIDMATAISGSGPAYFFLFVEYLVEAAVKLGLPQGEAYGMVLQTMLGASRLLQQSGKTPEELRRMVTSPGGTTAEAIKHFENSGLRQIVLQATIAAYQKARALGN